MPEKIDGPRGDALDSHGGRMLGDPLDGLGGTESGADLDLDLSAQPPRPSARASTPAPPTRRGPAEPDAREVRALADYGDPPPHPIAAISYAILVWQRRRELSRALAQAARLRRSAEEDCREALAALGRARFDAGEGPPDLRAEIEAAMAEAGDQSQARSESERANETQREALAARTKDAERAVGPFRNRESQLATQKSVAETDLRRVEARIARIGIELRNATEPRPDLEAEREARTAEAATARTRLEDLQRALADARRELAARQRVVTEFEDERRALEETEARARARHARREGEGRRRLEEALVGLGKRALADEATEPAREVKLARDRSATLSARQHELSLYEAALGAYDKRGFRIGAGVILGAAALVLASLIVMLVR